MTLSGFQYQCVAGETFDSVALAEYGNEIYSAELFAANPLLCLIPVFTGGELLNLPVVMIPDNSNEESFMPPNAPWKE